MYNSQNGNFKLGHFYFSMYCITGESVALVVNNLGGTSVLELNIVARAAITYLSK